MTAHRLFVAVQWLLIGALAACLLTGAGRALLPANAAALGEALRIVGLLLGVIAGGLAVAAFRALGRAMRIGPAPRPGMGLVTHGIYRRLRHPMYTAVVMVAVAAVLLRPTVGCAMSALAVIVFYLVKARYEEGLLRAAYPGYDAYRQRTHGVLPPL